MKKEKPKVGDIINYTKEVDTYVVDKNEKLIKCDTPAVAKMLSILLKLQKKNE